MPRRKIPISLIGNRRTRAVTFSKRKEGVMKKARELATLCDIPVAVVCADPDGGVADTWESEGGVFERYLSLPDEARAAHTHAKYLEDRLGKERAKLARQRQDGPDALAPPDAVLNAMTLDELQEVLGTVDAALWATGERRKTLEEMTGDDDADDGQLWQAEPDASSAVVSLGGGVPCNGSNFLALDGYQMYMPGNACINDGGLEQHAWDAFQPYNAGAMQPLMGYNTEYIGSDGVGMDGYLQLPMQGDGDDDDDELAWGGFQPRNGVVQPGYGGFPCDESSFVGMDGYQVQAPGNGKGWPNLVMPCNAIVPAGYYPSVHIGDSCVDSPAEHPTLSIDDDDLINALIGFGDDFINADGYGVDDNFMDADGYETQISSDDFQCSGTGQNSCTAEELRYLTDVAEGMRFASCRDRQLQLW